MSSKPGGRVPLVLAHVIFVLEGVTASSVQEYSSPLIAVGSGEVVTNIMSSLIVSEKDFSVVRSLLAATIVNVNVPDSSGVP